MAVESGVQTQESTSPASFPRSLLAFTQTRLFHVIVVLILGGIGYLVAPSDLKPGDYTATIRVVIDGQVIEAEYPFRLGQTAGEAVTVTHNSGPYQLVIEGPDAYAYRLEQRIGYRVQVLDANGTPVKLALDNVTSTLSGPGYEQTLPPTERSGDWLGFSMRVPFKARIALGLLFMVAALWLLEPIPLAAASLLIPVVVVITGVTNDRTVLQPFFHPIIVLFLAGFLMAEAMRRTGLDRLLALAILRRSSSKPAVLMLTMMAITAFLSMWMSNTASVAIIIPIALAVLEKFPEDNVARKPFTQAMILGVAYAGAIGGIGSAIGTPANMLALTFLSEFADTSLAFVDWFKYGLPMVIVMVPIIWLYLLLTFRVKKVDVDLRCGICDDELEEARRLTTDQRIIAVVFVVVMGLWLTENLHNISASIVALGGALALFFFSTLKAQDLNKINWNALLTFGGGMAIGTILVMTGVSDWIALQLIGLASLPAILVIFLVALLTVIIGALISNTACAAMLIPLAIPLAQILRIDPRLLVSVVAIASSIDFALVIGTPPTMLAYSTGFFEVREIFRRGVVLDLIGVLLLSFVMIWVWQLLGAVTLY